MVCEDLNPNAKKIRDYPKNQLKLRSTFVLSAKKEHGFSGSNGLTRI